MMLSIGHRPYRRRTGKTIVGYLLCYSTVVSSCRSGGFNSHSTRGSRCTTTAAFTTTIGTRRLSDNPHGVIQPSSQQLWLSSTSSSPVKLSYEALTEAIGDAYQQRETDGILELAGTAVSLSDYDLDDIVYASLEAVNNSKGKAAGILNGWIGACCRMDDAEEGGSLAWSLLNTYEDTQSSTGLSPDIVTYSLAHTALARVQQKNNQLLADMVLERATRSSKKKGRGKHRRSLAASRRKSSTAVATDIVDRLNGMEVLHETPHVLVLSKPSGIVCAHKRKTTAQRTDPSVVDTLLRYNVPLSSLNPESRGLVHRIDRGTSGCLVVAKTEPAHAQLVAEFFLRNVGKAYEAVVYTMPTDETRNGPGGGSLQDNGTIDIPVDKRPAFSSYELLERYNSRVAKLQVRTSTGRRHQVRVHCAKGLGSPILLDPIYADGKLWTDESVFPSAVRSLVDDPKKQRLMLHASSLSIPAFDIDVTAPVPSWWEEAIRGIQQKG